MNRSDISFIDTLEAAFDVPLAAMRRIMRDFRSEMAGGLSGAESSLKMIPTFVEKPTGNEKGRFIALDLGGTNFRVLEIELKGSGKTGEPRVKKFVIEKRYITGEGTALFDFIADCVKTFMNEYGIRHSEPVHMGFTFSFPVEQTKIDSGRLVRWTKGFSASGIIGNDVVGLLKKALGRKSIENVHVAALANDTVGTLVAKSYEDLRCDVGVILGTGTNACYAELLTKIHKLNCAKTPDKRMIINIEWGNFNRLRITPYDEKLDKFSENPGEQILEKRVSGKYLGEIVRLACQDCIEQGLLFDGFGSANFAERGGFKTEFISRIESDNSKNMEDIGLLLKELDIDNSSPVDRILIKKICGFVSLRAARISAAAIAAVITKIDSNLSSDHVVAIDGALYEKHPTFSRSIKNALREIFEKNSSRITLTLAKDGSGKGAAVIAAVASATDKQ